MNMKYIRVQWSFEYDKTKDNSVNEEYNKWLNYPNLSKAYVPEEMIREGINNVELAFERLTGIPKKHIVLFDTEPYYDFDEELEFLDMSDLFNSMSDEDLWQRLIRNEWEFIESRITLFHKCEKRVSLIRRALDKPNERGTALRLIPYLTNIEQQYLLDDLIRNASVAHYHIQLCREVILGLPRRWLLDNIKESLDKVLSNSLSEEYRQLLELSILINTKLTKGLIKQALNHQDNGVKEVGQEFQEYLNKQLYSPELKEVLVRMLELVNTNGDTDKFNHLLDAELPYSWWGNS